MCRPLALASALLVVLACRPSPAPIASAPTPLAVAAPPSAATVTNHGHGPPPGFLSRLIKLEMAFERAFVAAGGTLMAGCDPTGNGVTLPGFGDQRNVELLVEAGFTPIEALRIASLNGATFLGQQDRIGSIEPGKDADLVVVEGGPSRDITDIEKVEIVFKDGVGYDPQKLVDSVRGLVGVR